MMWQAENFPKLNEMYENDDFEGMTRFIEDVRLSKKSGVAQIYDWEHYKFASVYGYYDYLIRTEETVRNDKSYEKNMKDYIFYQALELCYGNYTTQLEAHLINEKDYKNIMVYKEYGRDFMRRHYGIDDLDSIASECALKPPAIGFDLSKIRKIMDNYIWTD